MRNRGDAPWQVMGDLDIMEDDCNVDTYPPLYQHGRDEVIFQSQAFGGARYDSRPIRAGL